MGAGLGAFWCLLGGLEEAAEQRAFHGSMSSRGFRGRRSRRRSYRGTPKDPRPTGGLTRGEVPQDK